MKELTDLLDLYLNLKAEIVGNWAVFITVNTAIFGWLVTKEGQHKIPPRIVAAAAYAFFAALAFLTLDSNYPVYEAVKHDVRLAARAAEFLKETQLKEQLIALSRNRWDDTFQWIYIFSAFCVVGFILCDVLSRPEKAKSTGGADGVPET